MPETGANVDKEQAIARHLLAEHSTGKPFLTLEGELALADMAEAYRAQQIFVALSREARGAGIAGYKIALTSAAMQAFVGVDHPLLGAILDDTVFHAPAEISLGAFQHVGVEFELALRLGRDVPPVAQPYNAVSIAPYVDAVIPAFELIEDRNAVYENFDARSLVADNAWSGAVVLGQPVTDWRGFDLAATPTRLETGGEVETATTGAALGNPLTALAWAANELSAQGRPLEAGMIVMTGSTLKTRFPGAGERFLYEVEGIGSVQMSIVP
ncbi:fumarylacetoacetate hydrolase family protein [Nisaea sp.]|uniref:2-keto-4-pentenoate hydratase n=1 Tax=Nisaea sp. TaxID=2024842 RepID=UPI0032EF6C1E